MESACAESANSLTIPLSMREIIPYDSFDEQIINLDIDQSINYLSFASAIAKKSTKIKRSFKNS